MSPTPVQTANRNKARGAWAERQIMADLAADGYIVVHSAGSLGVADVVAIKYGELLFVQVKHEMRDGRRAHIGPAAWNELYTLSLSVAAIPIIAIKSFRRIDYWRITGMKDRPTRTPPWEEWYADQVADRQPSVHN